MSVPMIRTTALVVALLLAGCGQSDEAIEAAQTTATEATESAAEAPAEVATTDAEPSSELAAVEESDGSFDAEEEAKEITLRMAQESTQAAPQRFSEGQHFQRYRPTKTTVTGTDGVEVAEVFWYGCNHCYNLEPTLKRWSSDLPADVTFVKLPAVWSPLHETHAQLFYTIEALAGADKISDKSVFHAAVFEEMHVNRNLLRTERVIRNFMEQRGIDRETFESGWNSFEVNTRMRQAKSLNRAYGIDSVPTMIVNGKYRTSEAQAGGKPDLIAVIEELVASER